VPAAQGLLDRGALGAVADRAAQQLQRAVAVVREVRMDANPARRADIVAAGVQPRQLVPHLWRAAIEREVRAAFEHRVFARHQHLLAAAVTQVPQLGRCAGRGRHAGLDGIGDRERTGQHRRVAGHVDVVERGGRQAGLLPQAGQRLPGGIGVTNIRGHAELPAR
jgi:hypothetical protein